MDIIMKYADEHTDIPFLQANDIIKDKISNYLFMSDLSHNVAEKINKLSNYILSFNKFVYTEYPEYRLMFVKIQTVSKITLIYTLTKPAIHNIIDACPEHLIRELHSGDKVIESMEEERSNVKLSFSEMGVNLIKIDQLANSYGTHSALGKLRVLRNYLSIPLSMYFIKEECDTYLKYDKFLDEGDEYESRELNVKNEEMLNKLISDLSTFLKKEK